MPPLRVSYVIRARCRELGVELNKRFTLRDHRRVRLGGYVLPDPIGGCPYRFVCACIVLAHCHRDSAVTSAKYGIDKLTILLLHLGQINKE